MDAQSYAAVMHDTADEVRGYARHLTDNVLTELQKGTAGMALDWLGQGGGRYQDVEKQFRDRMTLIAAKLAEVGGLLDDVASGHDQIDRKLVQNMDTVGQFDLAGDNVGNPKTLSALRGA